MARISCNVRSVNVPAHQARDPVLKAKARQARQARQLYLCRDRLSSPSAEPNPWSGTIFRYPSKVSVSR
jgi:hypothetical protein